MLRLPMENNFSLSFANQQLMGAFLLTSLCFLFINTNMPVMAKEKPNYKLQWLAPDPKGGMLVNGLQVEFYSIPNEYSSSFLRFYISGKGEAYTLTFDVCEKLNWDESNKKCKTDQRNDRLSIQEKKELYKIWFDEDGLSNEEKEKKYKNRLQDIQRNVNRQVNALSMDDRFAQNGHQYYRLKFELLCAHISNKNFEVKLVVRQENATESQIFDITVENSDRIASFGVLNAIHLQSGQSQKGKEQISGGSSSSSAIKLVSTRPQTHPLITGFRDQFYQKKWKKVNSYFKELIESKSPKGIVVWEHDRRADKQYLTRKLEVEYFDGGKSKGLKFRIKIGKNETDKYQFDIYEKKNENTVQQQQGELVVNKKLKNNYVLKYKLPNARQQHYSLLLVITRIIGATSDCQKEEFLIGLEDNNMAGQLIVQHKYTDDEEKVTFKTEWEEKNDVNLITKMEISYYEYGNYINFYPSSQMIAEGRREEKYKATMCDSDKWNNRWLRCEDVEDTQKYEFDPSMSGGIKRYDLKITGQQRIVYFTVEKPYVRQQVLAVYINIGEGMQIKHISNKKIIATPEKWVSSKRDSKKPRKPADGGSSSSMDIGM